MAAWVADTIGVTVPQLRELTAAEVWVCLGYQEGKDLAEWCHMHQPGQKQG